MDVREKLAFSICNATQKTNCKCDFKCEKKGKCAYCLVMAEQMIAHGVTVQKWIPVTERLPEEDVRVLVWVGENSCNFPVIDTDRIHKGRWVRWDEYITHWMPLPQPPKGE